MGGHNDGKADRSFSQRSGGSGGGGGGSVSEAGALFPRLHVKETNRVGPRAPPRNKMALYEQFTFASNRFVPPSMASMPSSGRPSTTPITTTPYAPQRTSYEGSLFYGLSPSFGVMPWMPYAAMSATSTGGPQPSLDGSSGSTIVDAEADLRHRAGVRGADGARQSSSIGAHGTRWTSSQSNGSGVSRKRSRLDDTSSNPAPPAKEGVSHETSRDALGIQKLTTWQPWQQRTAETSNRSTRLPVSSDCQVESSGVAPSRTNRGPHSVSDIARHVDRGSMDAARKGEKKRHGVEAIDAQDSEVAEKRKDRSHELRKSKFGDIDGTIMYHSKHGTFHGEKKSQAEFDVGSKVPKSRTSGQADSAMAVNNDDQGSSRRRNLTSVEGLTSVAATDAEKRGKENGETTARVNVVERESRKRTRPSECKSSSFVDEDDEAEIVSVIEASVRTDSKAGIDGEESESDISDPEAPRKKRKLSSRKVVKLVGVQEFWRTRDLLQRQQKIFSEQVFEMHRLIKVQQMLTSAADQVIDEDTMEGEKEVPGETSDHADVSADADYSADEQMAAEEDDNEADDDTQETEAVNSVKEAASAPATSESPKAQVKEGEKLQDTCQSSTSHRARTQPPVIDPAPERDKAEASNIPSVGPGESSASWSYPMAPKSDGSSWFGATLPAPGGAFMYQPYPAAFPPAQAHAIGTYTSPYGPVVCAPGAMDVSGRSPYGMPNYEQRMDMMPDMYRYNSYQQQWPPAMLCPPVPSNRGTGWFGVPAPMPYMDPALRGGWYEEMTPGRSAHPSGSSGYLRPPPGYATSAQCVPIPPAAAFVMQPSPWAPDVSHSHHSGAAGDKFRSQRGSWTSESGAGVQTASLASQTPTVSGSAGVNHGLSSEGRGFQRPPTRLAGQESFGTHSTGNTKSIGLGWGLNAGGSDFLERESDAAEMTPTRGVFKDRGEDGKQKKSRTEYRQEPAKEARDVDAEEDRHDGESMDAAEAERDALPLFPLAPVLNTPENRRLASQPSGVIKVVPRAVAATAESAAEILLSIQKQRQL